MGGPAFGTGVEGQTHILVPPLRHASHCPVSNKEVRNKIVLGVATKVGVVDNKVENYNAYVKLVVI